MGKYILADNQDLTRFALERLLKQNEIHIISRDCLFQLTCRRDTTVKEAIILRKKTDLNPEWNPSGQFPADTERIKNANRRSGIVIHNGTFPLILCFSFTEMNVDYICLFPFAGLAYAITSVIRFPCYEAEFLS